MTENSGRFWLNCLVAQLCLTLCDLMDCSPPGSSAHGILQQEYWSGLPCPPLGNLPNPGIIPGFPVLQEDSFQSEPSREAPIRMGC